MNLQRTSQIIIDEIASYYPEMTDRKTIHEVIKEVAKEKMNKLGVDDYLHNGVIMQNKKDPNYTLKEDELNEEAENRGFLHSIKKINKEHETRYNIVDFKRPASKYVRIHNSIPKETKAELDEKNEAFIKNEKERLTKKDWNEFILAFKENNKKKKQLEERYEKDRKELMHTMIKEDENKIYATEGVNKGKTSFSLLDKKADYNMKDMLFSEIEKRFLFSFKANSSNIITVKDWYTSDVFEFESDSTYLHDGHTIEFQHGTLLVDGIHLESEDLDETKVIKKKNKKELMKNNEYLVSGLVPVAGSDFLKSLPSSSSKIQHLIEKGIITEKEFKSFRFIEKEEDFGLKFEMITEESDSERRSFFHQRRADVSQRLLKKNKQRKTL